MGRNGPGVAKAAVYPEPFLRIGPDVFFYNLGELCRKHKHVLVGIFTGLIFHCRLDDDPVPAIRASHHEYRDDWSAGAQGQNCRAFESGDQLSKEIYISAAA